MRNQINHLAAARGNAWLHDRLCALDREAAAGIDARNTRRVVRALEVILVSGRRYSDQRLRRQPPYAATIIGLRRPRPELYGRVDTRIEAMWNQGLLEETRRLLDKGFGKNLPSMTAIGYAQCVEVIEGNLAEAEAKAQMRRLTRAFVRRQANWFKESDPAITWFDAGTATVRDQIAAFVLKALGPADSAVRRG